LFIVNFDGAVLKASNEVGLGVVLWDNQGLIHESLLKKVPLSCTSDDAEALAKV